MTDPSTEVILERLRRMQEDINNGFSRLERGQEDAERRLGALEAWRAGEERVQRQAADDARRVTGDTGIDWPKILLVALGLLGTALAIIATLASGGPPA